MGKVLLVAAVLVGILLSGCTIYVIPPPQLQEPRQVFLLDHGRHSSLVLSRRDGRLVRYSYGDWNYYALRKTGFWRGAAALLIPTTAALGRQEMPGPSTTAIVQRQISVGIEQILPIKAESQVVEELQKELESIYLKNLGTLVYNPDFDANFVKHPRSYSLVHNSNQMVAAWLEALGCEIRGWPILSNWQLELPEGQGENPTHYKYFKVPFYQAGGNL